MEINVLTYNVCWECMKGETKRGSAKKYGILCSKTKKIDGKNLCFRNIVDICSNNFDLIGLQESNLLLGKTILQRLGEKYDLVYSKSCREHSIIIYNKTIFKKKGKPIFGEIEECGRPFLFQIFKIKNSDKTLIVGNFHGPHINKDWIPKYLNKVKNYVNETSKIIIFGDFNKKIKKNYTIKNKKVIKILKSINKDINTSINKKKFRNRLINEENYIKNIDNILLSNNIKLLGSAKTLKSTKNNLLPFKKNYFYSNFTSDHRPISAKILL